MNTIVGLILAAVAAKLLLDGLWPVGLFVLFLAASMSDEPIDTDPEGID